MTLEVFMTVISGVLVYAMSQLFNEYFLKPIQDYKNLRSKIAYSLTLYTNLFMNPVNKDKIKKEQEDALQEIRVLSASVNAFIELRPKWNAFIPPKSELKKVSKALIGISHGFVADDIYMRIESNKKEVQTICSVLKIQK